MQWMCFDACPVTACLPYTARRIKAITPNAKLVFMVRCNSNTNMLAYNQICASRVHANLQPCCTCLYVMVDLSVTPLCTVHMRLLGKNMPDACTYPIIIHCMLMITVLALHWFWLSLCLYSCLAAEACASYHHTDF